MSVTEIEIAPSRALQRYYPWVVIGIAFLTVGVAFGARNAFAVFLVAVIEEFRWSRGLASGALMLGSLLWTLSAPVIGILLDRLGPRIVLPGGAIVMATGFVVSGFADSIVEFYIGMGVFMGVGFAALPMTSQATFLSNWFIRKRGMAIGAAASGIGLGILLVVPWTQWLITTYGWRAAFFILAALLALVIAPLNYFFQCQRPEEMNLKPDFGEPAPEKSAAQRQSRERGRSESEGSAAHLAILGVCIRRARRSDSVAHGLDSSSRGGQRRGVLEGTGRVRPRTDRTFYRAGDDRHGTIGRPDRTPVILPARLGIVDDRHFSFDDDQRRRSKLDFLFVPAFYRLWVFFPPVALSDHRRRSISRQVFRRDHRRNFSFHRRRRGHRSMARRNAPRLDRQLPRGFLGRSSDGVCFSDIYLDSRFTRLCSPRKEKAVESNKTAITLGRNL